MKICDIFDFFSRKKFILSLIMILWEKESNAPNALYVNMFTAHELDMLERMSRFSKTMVLPKKNDKYAFQLRKNGNVLFGYGKWSEALEKYNECLCYATNDSSNIALTYAKRASCFLNMKLYNQCLIDIDLARKSKYPDNFKKKLDEREADCLKLMEEQENSVEFHEKLSYESDENIPCMANVIKIKRNTVGKLSMIAKEDIDAGQTIILGKAFIGYLYSRFYLKCNICLQDHTNLVPCKNCTVAMFCCDRCDDNIFHQHECGVQFQSNQQQNAQYMNEVRILLYAINIFENADELMKFVEDVVKSDPFEIPTLNDDRTKYRAFLKLPISSEFANSPSLLPVAYIIYKGCLKIQRIDETFKSLKHRRFLMHLIIKHLQLSNYNTNQVKLSPMDACDLYQQLGLMTKSFNHSCAPNVLMQERDGNSIYVTICPIKKDEELFVSYFDFFLAPISQRQFTLFNEMHINCKCSRCKGQLASTDDEKRMLLDPDYKWIESNILNVNRFDGKKIKILMEKCLTFFNKYGRCGWCEPIGKVIIGYKKIINDRLLSPIY